MPTRLHTRPDRPEVTFRFNGKTLRGYEGEPIAAALMANGVDVFQRSLKYHNPRGVRCAHGRCGQCMVSVDGRPNVRSCSEQLKAGMNVRTQRGWPSAAFDLGRIMGSLTAQMPHGFHYRMFIRPAFLRPVFFGFIRKLSGYGAVDGDPKHAVTISPARAVRDVDVLVVGGGVAGMACAAAASERGASVVLIDDDRELGGHGRFVPGSDVSTAVSRTLSTCEVLLGRQAIAFDGGVLAAITADAIEKFRPKILVIATGGYDFIPPFRGNDGPRNYGMRAALRLLSGWGVLPASLATVVGPGANRLASTLADAGINAQTESGPRAPVRGEAMVYTESVPTHELQFAAGVAMTVDENGALVGQLGEGGVTSRPDVFVTGEAAGNCDFAEAAVRGAETGAAVVRALAGEHIPWTNGKPPTVAPPQGPVAGAMLCFCEDVTEDEFAEALHGDFPDIETAKRYTSLSMGVCQGKYCLHRARCITSAVRGTPLTDTPITVQRPPFISAPLGVVAAQREEVSK
jgi:sarcosine oxidase, subunit alpha